MCKDPEKFNRAVEMASTKPRMVAGRILKAGCYDDGGVYMFCQELHQELRKRDPMIAEEFKVALLPEVKLVC